MATAGQQEHGGAIPQQVAKPSRLKFVLTYFILGFERQSIQLHSPLFKDPHRGNQPHGVDAHDGENELQAQRGPQRRPYQPCMSHSGCLLPPQQENEETLQRVQGEGNTCPILLRSDPEINRNSCIRQTLLEFL